MALVINSSRNDFAEYFNSEAHSDLVIILENGEKLYAHRLILSMYSSYFHEELLGGGKYAGLDTITLDEYPADATKAAINLIYDAHSSSSFSGSHGQLMLVTSTLGLQDTSLLAEK